MFNFLAILLGTALDPIAIILGVIIGWASRQWWQVALAAVVIGVILEIVRTSALGSGQPYFYYIGGVAIWASIAFIFETKRRQRKLKRNSKEK